MGTKFFLYIAWPGHNNWRRVGLNNTGKKMGTVTKLQRTVARMRKVTAGGNWAYIPRDMRHIIYLGPFTWFHGHWFNYKKTGR